MNGPLVEENMEDESQMMIEELKKNKLGFGWVNYGMFCAGCVDESDEYI